MVSSEYDSIGLNSEVKLNRKLSEESTSGVAGDVERPRREEILNRYLSASIHASVLSNLMSTCPLSEGQCLL